jgi:hypothetical protein
MYFNTMNQIAQSATNTTLLYFLPSISEDDFFETACSVLQNDCSQERCDEYRNEIIQQIRKSN